jgi:hypothetical protein
MWKNILQPDRPQMTIWRMRVVCWINMFTDTLSDYVIFIAFPRQQLLGCLIDMLHVYSMYCVVIFIFFTHYMFHKLIAGLYYLCQRSKCSHDSLSCRIWHRAASHVLILKYLLTLRLKCKHFLTEFSMLNTLPSTVNIV